MNRIFGFILMIAAAWIIFGGARLLFWFGSYWGGILSNSAMPAIIYFTGIPIVLLCGVAVFVKGTELADI